MEEYNIIKELKQKGESGYESSSIKIGTEPRFISSMLNSNNNNFEEQNILGTDCVTVEWDDNNSYYKSIKYYDGFGVSENSPGYFLLYSEKYKNPQYEINSYFFEEDSLCFSDASGIRIENNELVLDNNETFSFSEEEFLINPGSLILERDTLYFRQINNGILSTEDSPTDEDILISTKEISKLNKNGKDYFREKVSSSVI